MIASTKATRAKCKNEFNNSALDDLIKALDDVADCIDNLGSKGG